MKALVVVDVQNDFLPHADSSLPVPDGDAVIAAANRLMTRFELVVATQDWHPADHESFASQHAGQRVGDVIELHGLEQMLWPDHCVRGTPGSFFADELDVRRVAAIFRKGMDREIDSYSGFYDNGHRRCTGMNGSLREHGVSELFIVGLALDVCVKYTAMDARRLGYTTNVVLPGCRAVNVTPGDDDRAIEQMRSAGARMIESIDQIT